jgi:hypothetical protein
MQETLLDSRLCSCVLKYENVIESFREFTIKGILGFDSRRGLGILLFTTPSRTAVGPTQPPIQ